MSVVGGTADVADVDRFVAWLGDVGDAHGCAVQAFDADYVASEAHVAAAVAKANRAFERGENVARDRAVEILLYAAGRRQINQAVEMGVSAGEGVPVVVAVDGDDEAGALDALADRVAVDDAVLASLPRDPARVRAFFDVTGAEADAAATDLSGLVRERVALLDVEK